MDFGYLSPWLHEPMILLYLKKRTSRPQWWEFYWRHLHSSVGIRSNIYCALNPTPHNDCKATRCEWKHPIFVWSMISVLDRQGFLLILFLLWATPATVVHLDLDWQSFYLQIIKLVAYLNCKIMSFSWSHSLSAHLQRGSSSVLGFYQYNGRWRETFWLSHAISTSPRQLEKKSLHQLSISSSMGPSLLSLLFFCYSRIKKTKEHRQVLFKHPINPLEELNPAEDPSTSVSSHISSGQFSYQSSSSISRIGSTHTQVIRVNDQIFLSFLIYKWIPFIRT